MRRPLPAERSVSIDDPVLAIQRLYPQIYLACHTQHVRRSTTPHELSAQDSSVLSHLDVRHGTRPGDLAAHLGVTPSTLSAAIARLLRLHCIERSRDALDRRAAELRLTPRGVEALQATSVLDRERLTSALSTLKPAERTRAVAGLALIARACNELMSRDASGARRKKTRREARRGDG